MNGLVLVDKPSGMTSHDVVYRVRKILGTRNVGHAGTLDPLASGLLVLLVGQATKFSDYLLDGDKGYEVEFRFGQTTDTFDVEGKIVEEKVADHSVEQIRSAVEAFTGKLKLPVPSFSAVKVGGKKLYEYARAGEPVPEVLRETLFYDVGLLDCSPTSARVALKCEKGGFIRSWVHFLGQKLGSGAVVTSLRRTLSSPYGITEAKDLDSLAENPAENWLIPMEDLMPNWPVFVLDEFEEGTMLNGQIPERLLAEAIKMPAEVSEMKVLAADRVLLAIISKTQGHGLKIRRVFPRSGG